MQRKEHWENVYATKPADRVGWFRPRLEISLDWISALELDPDHYMSYYRYAVQMRKDGNLQESERLVGRAITLQPMNTRFRLELAEVLEALGREEDALEERKKAEELQVPQ